MPFPLIAMPAITDEHVGVRTPTNLVLVQLDPDEIADAISAVRKLKTGVMPLLRTLSLESTDHEFVQTNDLDEDTDAVEVNSATIQLGHRLDDLAVSFRSEMIKIREPQLMSELRSYGLIRDCDTVEDLIEIAPDDNTLRFRGKYSGKNGKWCSSCVVCIDEFMMLISQDRNTT